MKKKREWKRKNYKSKESSARNQPDLHVLLLVSSQRPHVCHFDLTKTRAILVETSSLTKKCAGAEGEEIS